MTSQAIGQAAQYLFLADRSVDAVLLAYGTHHIPPSGHRYARFSPDELRSYFDSDCLEDAR